MTCKSRPRCDVFAENGSIIGCPAWKPENNTINIGDTVMVPRTGNYHSIGEVIEVYTDAARVKFEIGDLLHGKPTPEKFKGAYAYNTVKIKDLLLITTEYSTN